jgi:hypothetical protein
MTRDGRGNKDAILDRFGETSDPYSDQGDDENNQAETEPIQKGHMRSVARNSDGSQDTDDEQPRQLVPRAWREEFDGIKPYKRRMYESPQQRSRHARWPHWPDGFERVK